MIKNNIKFNYGKDYLILKSITYQINDKNGIHARPAGLIVQCAKRFSSIITIEKGGQTVDCKRLIQLMQLNVKCGDAVTITANGSDEEEAVKCIYGVMADSGL